MRGGALARGGSHHAIRHRGAEDCGRAGLPECVAQLLPEAGRPAHGRRSALLTAMELPERGCADILVSSEEERTSSGVTRLMVEARYGGSAPDALLGDTGRSAIDGKTALMHAAIAGNLEMVRMLKHKEAEMQDRLGRTALMYAALFCRPGSAALILRSSVDRDKRALAG